MGLSALARHSAWTLVAIRAAVWLGTALALVWAPYVGVLFGDAYGAWSDLLFRTFAQWDARWFVQISENGYAAVPEAAAFFPLYPALVHALAWVTGSTLVAGTLISLASAAVAAAVLAELARKLLGDRAARDAVLYLALYPVAFVFTAVYSDALFLALAAASFLAAERGRPVLAGVLAGLATGTRLIGLALVPALALLLWRGRGQTCSGWRRSCSRPRRSGCTRSTSTASSATPAPSRARRRPGTATPARSGRSRARSTRCARPAAG